MARPKRELESIQDFMVRCPEIMREHTEIVHRAAEK